jgi:hypothetical protein
MITVDGDGTVADGRKSGLCVRLCEIAGSRNSTSPHEGKSTVG